jgi:hypothetical protein
MLKLLVSSLLLEYNLLVTAILLSPLPKVFLFAIAIPLVIITFPSFVINFIFIKCLAILPPPKNFPKWLSPRASYYGAL